MERSVQEVQGIDDVEAGPSFGLPLLVTGLPAGAPLCAGASMSSIGIRVPYPNFHAAQGTLWQIDKLPCPGRDFRF